MKRIDIQDQNTADCEAQVPVRAGHVCPFLSREHIQRGLQSGRYVMTRLGLERRCTRCREYWPANTEFFYSQPSASGGLNCSFHDLLPVGHRKAARAMYDHTPEKKRQGGTNDHHHQ
jgi:hypothetical protein